MKERNQKVKGEEEISHEIMNICYSIVYSEPGKFTIKTIPESSIMLHLKS